MLYRLYSEQLQRSQKAIKYDAVRFSMFFVLFLIPSIRILHGYFDLEIALYCAFLNLPYLLAAVLGFICSKTHHKSYLVCYNFTLVIITIWLVLYEAKIIIILFNEWNDWECDYETDICVPALNVWIWIGVIISGFLFLASCVVIIITIVHSNKLKGLLSCEMKEYQAPLMVQEGISVVYPI